MGPQGKTWVKPTELVWLVLRGVCFLAVGESRRLRIPS